MISPSETLDATLALRAFGVERMIFRESLAATLVKDAADRATFDDEFDRFFAGPDDQPKRRTRRRRAGDSGGSSGPPPPPDSNLSMASRNKLAPLHRAEPRPRAQEHSATGSILPHGLRNKPFKEMTLQDVDDCSLLLQQLATRLRARHRRRWRSSRHGRIELRRTLRRSIATGGVPMEPQLRRRRPGKVDLVALCDCSHSVALSSQFLMSLISGAGSLFRRVRSFGYVDRPVEIWFERGHVTYDQPLDLYARSDLGRVLTHIEAEQRNSLTRNTLFLILGDARNNRRPPRADVLAAIQSKVQRVAWLNPEPRERWGTGDSVMRSYAQYCADVFTAATPTQLYVALSKLLP